MYPLFIAQYDDHHCTSSSADVYHGTARSRRWTKSTINISIDLFMRNFTMDKPRGTADARYDLPLYMSGIWEIQMGERSFLNYIWQECLGKQC